MPALQFTFFKEGKKHYASASSGPRFFVGTEMKYGHLLGLCNLNTSDGPVYKPEDWIEQWDHWAYFLQPTSQCESKGSFHCLNTYDRAAFTFTFTQCAAHVPDGDFVLLLRALLQLPEAANYFPYLRLQGGRVVYSRDGVDKPLETAQSSEALMKYLNPSGEAVEDQERICAARFVHWAQNSAAHRALQVRIGVETMQKHLKRHAIKLSLDGYPDYICQAVCDVFHQGRAKYVDAQKILSSAPNREAAYQGILDLGKKAYPERIATLRAEHKKLRDRGIFGKTYDAASGRFV